MRRNFDKRLGISVLGAALCLHSASGCDSADEVIPSRFGQRAARDAVVVGRVRRANAPVEGARIGLFEAGLSGVGDALFPIAVTGGSGLFEFPSAPPLYDLTIAEANEVHVFSGVGRRYTEPLLAGIAPARGFVAHVKVVVEPAPPPNARVVLALGGSQNIVAASGDLEHGLDVVIRQHDVVQRPDDPQCFQAVAVQALQIESGGDLTSPQAYGRACVSRAASGETSVVTVQLAKVVAPRVECTIQASIPAGMEAEEAELFLDFGLRYLSLSMGRRAVSNAFGFVPLPYARYAVRARARSTLGTSDSGFVFFDPNASKVEAKLPSLPVVRGPALDGSNVTFDVDTSAGGVSGVRELELVAQGPRGATARIVTTHARVLVPDPSRLGSEPLSGAYASRVRWWPDLSFVEGLSGTDARDGFAFAETAPVIVSFDR